MHKSRLLTTLLALSLPACDAVDDDASPDPSELADDETTPDLSEIVMAPDDLVTVTELNAADLFDAVKDLAIGESVETMLELGDFGSIAARIERTALVPDGFAADQVDGNGKVTAVPFTARSYRATSGTTGIELDLLIGPDRLAGVLRRDAKEYALSALNEPTPATAEPVIGVFRVPQGETRATSEPTCGVADGHDGPDHFSAAGSQAPHGTPRAGNCWKLEVRSHADYEFFKGVGKNNVTTATWTVLEGLVGASARFSTINLDLALPQGGGVTILTAPQNALYYPTSSDADVLLEQVRDFWNFFLPDVDRDLVILFTGKDIHRDGLYSVGGIAYIGQVCKNQSASYAVVESRTVGVSSSLIVAHEVGHIIGAEHTNAGIMTPNGSGQSFSQTSRDQMNNHIWFHHTCMPSTTCTQE